MKAMFVMFILFSISGNIYSQSGTILVFACCYEKDSITLIGKNGTYFQKTLIDTEPSTGIDGKIFFIDSSFFNTEILIQSFNKGKCLKLKIREAHNLQFLYVWFEDEFRYRFYDEPLKIY